MAKKKRRKHSAKIGLPPGVIMHIGEQKVETAAIELMDYNVEQFTELKLKKVEDSFPFKQKSTISWLNIAGLHDTDLIQKIGKNFDIHPLILEDILNTEQRSKVEVGDNTIFAVLKMFTYNIDQNELQKEQISFVLGENFVISFQERSGDIFDPVRERIRIGKGRIRKFGADYLLYALLDIIIDYYFLVMESIGDEIDSLENLVINNPDQKQLQRIHFLKREIVEFKKSVWPVREIVNGLIKQESELIEETTEPYMRDLYDHIINVSEIIESMREMVNDLLNTYLTNVSNRMNEIMKVLTIIATIFIPLTFLAGIYGMNFEFMPELKLQWAYPAFWAVSGIIFILLIFYFKRKKWF